MANNLNLEEQEQLDELKHFWNRYGNLITGVIIVVLGTLAAWNGYQYWQRTQSTQAAALFDEVERLVSSNDTEKAERAFAEMKERFPGTAYAPRAGFLLAKMAMDSDKVDTAKAALNWVSEHAADRAYVAIARLRLSGVLMQAKAYDDALKVLSSDVPEEFSGLVLDRRADIFVLQDKKKEAIAEYQKAFKALDERLEYRRLVEVKLGALGSTVEATP
jgi:predicted negative regulator of RcsB-dependent stress response